jgi:helix-turn-helix protein
LSPTETYALYHGALSLSDERERLDACLAVVGGARLGLRADDLAHLHDGWIDWERGLLAVPAFEPCACTTCCDAARETAAETDRQPLAVVYDEQWSPTDGGRTLSFGWSRRLTAALATHVDHQRRDGFDRAGRRSRERLLRGAADAAPALDPTAVDFETLRATAGQFFAAVGFDAASVARLLGCPDETAAVYVRRYGDGGRERLEETFGADTARAAGAAAARSGQSERFPLVADPTPFEREPFDPTVFDAARRSERADGRRDPTPVSNPRPVDVPGDVDYSRARHLRRSHLDPNSGRVSLGDDDRPTVSTLGQWVAVRERRRRRDSETDSEGTRRETDSEGTRPETDLDSTRRETDSESTRREIDSDRRAPGINSGGGGAARADSDDGTRRSIVEDDAVETTAATETTPVEDTSPGGVGEVPPDDSFAPRDKVTEPVAVAVSTQFAVAGLNGGQPTSGRVVLGAAELLFAADGETLTVPLSAVRDVAVDYVPSGMDDIFDSTVGVAYREDGNRRLAVGEFPGRKQLDVADALFEHLLDGETVLVTHPSRVGGRVTDSEPRRCTISVDGRRLSFRDDGETVSSVEPSSLLHTERGRQTVADGTTVKAVKIRHDAADSDDVVTTEVSAPDDRVFRVLERRVTHDYRRRERRLRELDLSEEEKETLVALYSVGDDVTPEMLLDVDPDGLGQLLESLADRGLVDLEGDDPGLTAMGETAVVEKLDDVNV